MQRMAGSRIGFPRRARVRGSTLTALADAMFQLLVFFMLSSNLTPYSLLPLRRGALASDGPAAEGQRQGASSPVVSAGETAIWSISRDSIVASGQRFSFDRLDDLAGAMQAAPSARVLLVTRPGANVQSLVAVLEALAAHGISDVQVASAAGSG